MDDPSPETKTERKAPKRPERRAKGFERAASLAPVALKSAGARRGFAELRLVTEWEAVVGVEFALLCRPVKVTWRGRGGGGLGATLLVAASGARAPELEMRAPALLERVNAFYGYRAVSRLAVDQSRSADRPPTGLAEATSSWEAPPPAPIEGIADERLALALARLGANVRAKSRASPNQRKTE